MYFLQAITAALLLLLTATSQAQLVVFNPASYFPELFEEQPVGTRVVEVGAAYLDSFGLVRTDGVFSMQSTGDAQFFTIETEIGPTQSMGVIKTGAVFDRDVPNAQTTFSFPVTYTTPDGSSSSVTVNVFLQDINDNAPRFTERVFVVSLLEDTVGGAPFFNATATDPDLSLREQVVIDITENLQDIVERYTISNGRIRYNITSGNSLGHFEINTETGTLSVAQGVVLDVDLIDFYNLTVMATDGGGLSDTANVFINILDSNDNPPQVLSPLGVNLTISEDTPLGYVVVDAINATDLDRGVNAEIRFLITSGDITNSFTIDEVTGHIIVSAPLDREMGVVIELIVAARDQGLPQPLQDTIQVMIHLLDVNDFVPQFSQPSYSASVLENSRAQTTVTQIEAIDLDQGPNGTVTYTILEGGDGNFLIDPLTGVIVTNVSLDRELVDSYGLVIGASDNPLNISYQLSSEVNVTVLVGDSNDNSPIFLQQSYEDSILDNLRRSTEILQVFATDADSGTNGQIRYVISEPDSTNPNAFTVNETSGVVFQNRRITFESQTVYNFTIQALDSGAFPRTDSTIVTIYIHNVNENPPVFDQSEYNVTIFETTDVGMVVLNVSAQDIDMGLIGEVRYRIVSDFDAAGSFEVNETSGDIFVNSTLDFDFRDFVFFVVEAYDGGFPLPYTDRTNVTVFLIGENDEAPSINFPIGFQPTVPENDLPGIEVVVLANYTSDPDFGLGGIFTFRLVDIFDQVSQNDSFSFNETTGLITSLRSFDREKQPEGIVVAIETIDFGDSPQSKVTNITIIIGDKNDNPPYFETNATAEAYEFMPPGIMVLSNYTALDDDIGVNARVEYDIYSGVGSERFTIDQVTGVISTAEMLNKTVQKYYNLTIIALDQGVPQMFGFGSVFIEVLDANDRVPIFTESVYNASLFENAPLGTFVARVNASDSDVGTNAVLEYFLSSNAINSDLFEINSTTGEIFSNDVFDRENVSVLNVQVVAIDNGLVPLTGSATVMVNIQDRNDNPPLFNESAYTANVIENAINGTSVSTVLAIDVDAENPNDIITYSLRGNRSEIFSIDSASGEVVVAGEVDWEQGGQFAIIVVATDGGIPQLTATTDLTIFIEDVNDQAPMFVPSSLNLSIFENTPAGNETVVGFVEAIDLDSLGNNSNIAYSVVMDFSNGRFQLDSETGLVTFVRRSLDRERRDLYDLLIRASDHGNPQLHTNETLYITVLDSNEFSPVFDRDIYTGSVAERADNGTAVLTIRATDIDIGSNGQLRYSIVSGSDGTYFQVDEVSGVVSTASELFDFETRVFYEFGVFVTDLGSPEQFNDSARVRITLTDSNDNFPIFVEPIYSAMIRENLASGTTVLRAIATDLDSGTNAEIEYTLQGGGSEHFGIDPLTGVLYTNQYINREETPMFDLVITANNSAAAYPLISTVQAVITVTDLNDMHPTFDLVTDVFIPEDAELGSVIYTLAPQDGDEGSNGSFSFALLQGNEDGYFSLDTQSGNITLLTELDYEVRELYVFVVMATDGGTPSLSNYTNVLIHVVDVNDNEPRFFTPNISVTISFAASVGTIAANLQAYDIDSEPNSQLEFTILDGNELGLFELASSSDGIIQTALPLQAHAGMTIQLTVDVSNPNLSGFSTGFVDILIDDGSSGLPRFTSQNYTAYISESSLAGDVIFDFSGLTVDVVMFSVSSPVTVTNNTAFFSIDAALGIVTVGATSLLNFESQRLFLLPVEGRNGGGDSAYSVLSINIIDENEHPPQFISNSFFIALPETTPTNQPFFRVIATDEDGSPPSNVISYSLTTTNPSLFGINSQTGDLFLRTSLDFEFSERNFNFTATATNDRSPDQLSTDVNVSVTVLNGNSFDPVFDQTRYTVFLLENATVGLSIVNVSATDSDQGSQGQITYGLHGDHDYLDFRVDTFTGEIFINNELDFERHTFYTLQVIASDGGNPNRIDTASVLIQIQDLNDNSPIWESTQYSLTISENVTVGSFLIGVLANDADQVDRDNNGVIYIRNGYVTYNITDGDPIGQFLVDPDTGFVTLVAALNREQTSEYILTLRATDGGGRFAESYLHITVTDVNDQTPQFIESPYIVDLPENSPNDTLVVTVHAVDTDLNMNSEITYQFRNSSDEEEYVDSSGTFYLNDTTGDVFLTVPIDREEISSYTLVVEAIDMGTTPLTGVVEVRVQVADINEFPPEFTTDVFEGEVFENEPGGTAVLQVVSSDLDFGENSTVLYSITEGNALGLFAIVSNTGMIEVAGAIDFEIVQEVRLIVMATDVGPIETRLINQTNVTILILDRNDNSPQLESSYTAAIPEDASLGDTVLSVFATDLDSGVNAELTYSLNTLEDVGVETNFDIDPLSGEIFLTNLTSLDRELTLSYSFIVNVTDGGTPQLYTNSPVTVFITDVNDNTPQFTNTFFQGSLLENSPSGTPIVSVMSTDNDIGTNADIIFEITSLIRDQQECLHVCEGQIFCNDFSPNNISNNVTLFSIDPQDGQICSAQPLDREVIESYVLVVQASDSPVNDSQLSNTTCVFVDILDENDEFPTFSQNLYQAEISEYAQIGEFVEQVLANDRDVLSNAEITFELLSESGSFAINPSTGVIITLINNYDRETRDLYNVSVLARDGGVPPLSSSAVVMVTILDENDSPPRFSQSLYPASIQENLPSGESVFQTVASDMDTGSNANLSYSIESVTPPRAHFMVDRSSGLLSTTQPLDREDVESYIVTVMATDAGAPPLTGVTVVNVTVLDTNDLPPVFINLPYAAQIEENILSFLQPLLTVSAMDSDISTNGEIFFSLQSVEPASNAFEINITSGVILVREELDAEYSLNFNLTVNASNGAAIPEQSTLVIVEVQVVDLNDNSPYFEQNDYVLPLLEATPIGSDVIELRAFDDDVTSQNSELRFEIFGGFNRSLFEINSTTGVVYVAGVLDRETEPVHILEITVTDNGSPQLNVTTSLTILLQDFNDNSPIFEQRSYVFSIEENLPLSSLVGRIQANDLDEQNVTYYFMDSGLFFIDPTSGEIFTAAVLDREQQQLYSFVAIATDGGASIERTAEVVVNVTLLDLNDVTPSFQNSTYTISWPENTTLGSVLLTVVALDEDLGMNSTLLYSLLPGNDSHFFSVNSTSGEVQLESEFDREEQDSFYISLTAQDLGSPSLTGTAAVVVRILDKNDNVPVLNATVYRASVLEDTAVGSVVLNIGASDRDIDENANISFYLSEDFNGTFTIGRQSGIVVLNESLDYEAVQSFSFMVIAQDGGKEPLSNSSQIFIEVVDLNDNSPVFDSNTYSVSIPENSILGSSVFQIPATDADATSNSELRYAILSGNVGSVFAIDETFGLIIVSDYLDREVVPYFILGVRVVDSGTPQFTATASVEVTIQDINDHPPQFDFNVYSVSISETISIGMEFISVGASDLDSEPNANLTYTIINGNTASVFVLDSNTGAIQTSQELDFESVPSYSLTVLVSDNGYPNPLTDTTNVLITLTNVNEHPPTFTSSIYLVNISENAVVGTPVGFFVANDRDTRSLVEYSLQGGEGYFEVDRLEGIVYVSNVLTPGAYGLILEVSDGDHVTNATVHVTVVALSVASTIPLFNQPSFYLEISETASQNSTIGSFGQSDIEILGMQITFDVSATGSLLLIGQIDHETTPIYILNVMTTYSISEPPLYSIVTLRVLDENDNPPVFESSKYTAVVSELVDVETNLLTLRGFDIDSPGVNSDLMITLSSVGNEGGQFAIDYSTGELMIVEMLDYEDQATYNLTVIVTNNLASPSLYSTAQVVVEVVDENDNDPVFSQTIYRVQLPESTPIGMEILVLEASDFDSGTNAELVYAITHLSEPLSFVINNITGSITTNTTFNFTQDVTSSYVISALVSDRGSPQPRSDTTTIFIDVAPDNLQPPRFSQPSGYFIETPETLPVGSTIVDISAFDPDSLALVEFSITSGDPSRKFTIDPSTGSIKLSTPLDYDQQSLYTLTISATDFGAPPRTSFVGVNVSVIDINNHDPRFTQTVYEVEIFENITIDAFLVQTVAVDPDAVDITYQITVNERENNIPLFSINSTSGEIVTAARIDREFADVLEILVSAIDSGYPVQRSKSITVRILVGDLNDNAPVFTQPNYSLPAVRLLGPEQPVAMVTATDADVVGDNLTYAISEDASDGLFRIDSVTGQITTTSVIPEVVLSGYNLVVTAFDGVFVTAVPVTIQLVNDGEFCNDAGYCTRVREVNCTFDIFPFVECNPFCSGEFELSPERRVCLSYHCVISNLVPCVAMETCLPPNQACAGACPTGMSVCPTTDLCHVTSLTESCDMSNETCLIGQTLVQRDDSSRICSLSDSLPPSGQNCTDTGLVYCQALDECHQLTEPFLCQACPDDLVLCADTGECVSDSVRCCGPNGYYCDSLNTCLEVGVRCELSNIAPVVNDPLVYLEMLEFFELESSNQGHVIALLLGNSTGPAVDSQGEEVSIAIVQASSVQSTYGEWQYALCNDSLSVCNDWVSIESNVLSENNALVLPSTARVRFLRRAIELDGAVWLRVKLFDGNSDGFISLRNDLVQTHVPSFESTLPYSPNSAFSENSTLIVILILPLITPPLFNSGATLQLSRIQEDVVFADNLGNQVSDFVLSIDIPNFSVLSEDRIEGFEDIVSRGPADSDPLYFEQLLPVSVREAYYDQVGLVNPTRKQRQAAAEYGQAPGVAVSFDSDSSQGTWQVSLTQDTRRFVNLDSILQNVDSGDVVLFNTTARLRFLPANDFCGSEFILVRPWDGYWNQTLTGFLDDGFLVVTPPEANSSSALTDYNLNEWERVDVDVECVPDKPVVQVNRVLLDPIPYRIAYRYERVFTVVIDGDSSSVRAERTRLADFLQITLQEPVDLKRISPALNDRTAVSFSVEGDVFSFNEVRSLILDRLDTLSDLGFPVVNISQDVSYGSGAGCLGDQPQHYHGVHVNTFISQFSADGDGDFVGVAVVAMDTNTLSQGVWQYHRGNWSSNEDRSNEYDQLANVWINFPSPSRLELSDTQALLLHGNDRFRYLPHPDVYWGGSSNYPTPSISVKIWDGSVIASIRNSEVSTMNINTNPTIDTTQSLLSTQGLFSDRFITIEAARLGCDGVVNSGIVHDACCVCGGSGASCEGCDGVTGSNTIRDACDVCGGALDSCLGCDFIPFSRTGSGECSECISAVSIPSSLSLERFTVFNTSFVDCSGRCYGNALLDECAVCSGGVTSHDPNTDIDCAGVCFGEAIIDSCGDCTGPGTSLQFNQNMDCTGVCNGPFLTDTCGVCQQADQSGRITENRDCDGVCFGVASIDSCDMCVGGTTNLTAGYSLDACDVCEGDNTSCVGCDGLVDSGLSVDSCGVCGGNDCGCFQLDSISPNRGPRTGGTEVVLEGAGFFLNGTSLLGFEFDQNSPNCGAPYVFPDTSASVKITCLFVAADQQLQAFAVPVDQSTIRCITESTNDFQVYIREFSVRIRIEDGPFSNPIPYFYDDYSDIAVGALIPSDAEINREGQVSIQGSNFLNTPTLTCIVYSFEQCVNSQLIEQSPLYISGSFVSSTEVSCQLPPANVPCQVLVRLSLDGQESGIVEAAVTTFTYLYSSPNVESVHFSRDLANLLVQFDRQVRLEPDISPNCSEIFESQTFALIGGEDAVCSWADNSQQQLVISLPSTASITINSEVTLKDNVIATRYQLYSYPITNTTIPIDTTQNAIRPVAVLNGPRSIPVCGQVSFSGVDSQYPGYSGFQYHWAVHVQDSTIANYSQLLTDIDSFAFSSPMITVHSDLFLSDVEYYLQLYVVNSIGLESEIKSVLLLKDNEPRPFVVILGAPSRELRPGEDLTLQSIITPSECDGMPQGVYSYTWRMTKIINQRQNIISEVDLSSLPTSSPDVVIPGSYLEPDSNYTVSLQVLRDGGLDPTLTTLCVSVSPLALQAQIDGGNRSVSQSREIVLDARDSSRPPLTSASFTWGCQVVGSLDACYNRTHTGLIPTPISLPGAEFVSFPASHLEVNRMYVFTLTLEVEGAVSVARVSIEVVASRPPIVEINIPQSVVLSTESLSLEGLVFTSSPVETVYWESLDLIGQGTVDLRDTNTVQSQTTYLSTPTITQTTSLTDYQSIPLEASIATNTTSRVSLVLSPNTLIPGLRYTFRMTAVSGEGTSYSQVTVTASSPPLFTTLLATPTTGVALETEFILDAVNTVDDFEASPFLYEFGVVEDENLNLTTTSIPDHVITWLSGVQTSNRLTAVLPNSGNSSLVILVRVFNRNGESSDALTQVRVQPNLALRDEASFTSLVNNIRNRLADTKDWNKALTSLLAVTLELNSQNMLFVNTREQMLDIFVNVFEEHLPPSLTHYQLATSFLTHLTDNGGIVSPDQQVRVTAVLNIILQWYNTESAIEHMSNSIPSQNGNEPLYLQSSYTPSGSELLSGSLARNLLMPLTNLLATSPNSEPLLKTYVESVEMVSRLLCRGQETGEEADILSSQLSSVYTKLAQPQGAFDIFGVIVDFKDVLDNLYQTLSCVGSNVPCMETCFSGVLYAFDLLGNRGSGTQVLQLNSDTSDMLISGIEGSDPQNVELFSDIVSISVSIPSQNSFLQVSELDSTIQVLIPKKESVPNNSQPLCLYRDVGGGKGFENKEWLLDTVLPPQTTAISGREFFVCEFNHLTEFAIGLLPPPVITTPPPVTTPPLTTMETTAEPTTMTTRPTTEPTTLPTAPPSSPAAAIAVVIVVVLIIVVVIVVLLIAFFVWRKKRTKKLQIEPATDETDGPEEDAKLTKAGPLTPEESKVSMQVILCAESGERKLIGKLNVLPSIRLRELRYQLADNFAMFKNKPFYFLTRQLCDIEPAAEQQQFVSLVFGDKPIFVREVSVENELTKKHFCVCGNAAQFECSNCSSQGYCSPECQHKHWTEQHQRQCSKLSEKRRRSDMLIGRPATSGNLPSELKRPQGIVGSPRRVTLATAPSSDGKATSPTTPSNWKGFMNAGKSFQQSPERSTSVVSQTSPRASLGELATARPSLSQQGTPRAPASLGPLQRVSVSSVSSSRTLPPLSRSASSQGYPQALPRTSVLTPNARTTSPNFYGSGPPAPLQSPLRAQPNLFTRPDPRQAALRPPAPVRHMSIQSVGSEDLGFSMSRDVRNEPLLESDEEDYETSTTSGSSSPSPTPQPPPIVVTSTPGDTPTRQETGTSAAETKPVTPVEETRQTSSRPTSSKRPSLGKEDEQSLMKESKEIEGNTPKDSTDSKN